MRLLQEICSAREKEAAHKAELAEVERRREAARRKAARQQQEQEKEDRRQYAIKRTVGDIIDSDPEAHGLSNPQLAAICAKVSLFFNHSSVNKRDVYTAISLDYAQFQATTFRVPNITKILQRVVSDLDLFLAVEAKLADARRMLEIERHSAEGKINSIGSRTHVFGGSGDGLLLSWLCASSAAHQDEKQMQRIANGHRELESRVNSFQQAAMAKQRLIEFRAKTAIGVLLPRDGPGSSIMLEIPADIEALAQINLS